jgi:antitoxin (DNA-binding transcriptional repressor) of toxin-antitoxin stability system
MCYMMEMQKAPSPRRNKGRRTRPVWRVGVREMRQNLSVYLDRVKAGETLHVTEYGQVVAMLSPLPVERLSPLQRMVKEGRAIAPTASLKDRRPPRPAPPGAPSTQEILDELRAERL